MIRESVTLGFWLTAMLIVVSMPLSAATSDLPGREDITIGSQAPAFSLQGSDGRTYTLEQFRGHSGVVLAFFPKAFTGG